MEVFRRSLDYRNSNSRIPKDSPFVGAISCKKCHALNYQNWLKAKHERATQTLASSPKYSQEECLIFHLTVLGRWENIPPWKRSLSTFEGYPREKGVSRKVTLSVCRYCHTKDQSPAFNYLVYIEKIGCHISQ